jgi:hypothetical protein
MIASLFECNRQRCVLSGPSVLTFAPTTTPHSSARKFKDVQSSIRFIGSEAKPLLCQVCQYEKAKSINSALSGSWIRVNNLNVRPSTYHSFDPFR